MSAISGLTCLVHAHVVKKRPPSNCATPVKSSNDPKLFRANGSRGGNRGGRIAGQRPGNRSPNRAFGRQYGVRDQSEREEHLVVPRRKRREASGAEHILSGSVSGSL